jgi:isocitrate dehydrogenase
MKKITVIPGDGIGPEVVNATRKIIDAAGVKIQWEERHAGASVFKQGIPSGVPQDTIDSIKETKVALKGPLETPVGFGEKSANVTLRKLFETYGNIRPVKEIAGVPTPYSGRKIDLIVVRENVEDLYAGIEHMQTADVAQCLKIISRKGCEKIIRLAFEVARSEGRKKVHCATKSNIMKLTEGLLKSTFEKIAPEYPDIESNHIIIDNCAHQLVKKPEQFDVIVTTNMNGDIISDLTSALIGGLGFAPSANIGSDVSIFEAVHGSAPKYAGKNVINPTAMILSGIMMLRHIGELEAANKIENAVLYMLESGQAKTRDIVGDRDATSTSAFTEAIISNLGKLPKTQSLREHKPIDMKALKSHAFKESKVTQSEKGVDIFIQSDSNADFIGNFLSEITEQTHLKLKMISNRGTQVYPDKGTLPDTINHWRCRFKLRDTTQNLNDENILELVVKIGKRFRWNHVEKLTEYNSKEGFTKAQGED